MGGRGSSAGGGGGGGSVAGIISERPMSNERETALGMRKQIDQVLTVSRDVSDQYGVVPDDILIAKMKGGAKNGTLAYYSGGSNSIAVNEAYMTTGMDQDYDRCVQSGFHPSRGNKSAMEAVAAHELGHMLTYEAMNRATNFNDAIAPADGIVRRAAKASGMGIRALQKSISGYATHNYKETVAEAFADVYCNGSKASKGSLAVVSQLNKFYGK